jgi:hypothetical protein
MSTEVSAYSAANMNLSYLGVTATGFADGDDAIMVERDVKTMTKQVGMKGDGVFSQSVDRSGKITLKLLQNSAFNAFLTKKMAATEAGAIASGAMICDEVGGDSGFTANKTTIEGFPAFKRGQKANVVEWVFLSIDINIRHGQGVQL